MARPRRKKPVTAERIERALDTYAWVISIASPEEAARAAPLWRRLEQELAKKREEEVVIAAARERLRRSQDRTAARS